jgi:hypothetical protein
VNKIENKNVCSIKIGRVFCHYLTIIHPHQSAVSFRVNSTIDLPYFVAFNFFCYDPGDEPWKHNPMQIFSLAALFCTFTKTPSDDGGSLG